ncbi:MAG: AraC family transcriptional regulator [Verrucomicrobiota bacterium JB024]|nr:AraC family transcriptional regulator [Verrucomicrobiota bacterium JB024]
MSVLKRWFLEDAIYRGSPGKSFGQSLSCGFLNKSGLTEDVTNEQYTRFAMIYLLNGRGWYSDSLGQEVELRAGDLFFRCPDRRHTTRPDPQSGWRETFVSLRSDWYGLFRAMELIPAQQACFTLGEVPHIPEFILGLMKRLRSADNPADNIHVEFDIAGLMRWVLARVQETHHPDAPRLELLKHARERIREQAATREPLELILKGTGLSYSRLRSLFRQTYGTGPGEYRVQVRIEQACALLETTGDRVQEIADRLGYSDAFAFSKQFRQHVGVSPSAFRKHRR